MKYRIHHTLIALDLITKLVQRAHLELPQSRARIEAHLRKSGVSAAADMTVLDVCVHGCTRPNLQSAEQLGARIPHDPGVVVGASEVWYAYMHIA